MKTFYFTRRRMTSVFEVKAKSPKAAWAKLDANGGRRIDYTRTNASGTPIHLI